MATGLRIPNYGNVYSQTARFTRTKIGSYASGMTFSDCYAQQLGSVHLYSRYINDYWDASGGEQVGRWNHFSAGQTHNDTFTSYGYISTFTYYTIKATISTRGSSSAGGTVTGAGNYDSGATATIKAKPNTGFVLKSLDGYAGTLPTKSEVSLPIVVNADQTINAVFQKVYDVVFNKNVPSSEQNTVTNMPESMLNIEYETGVQHNDYLPDNVPVRPGYTFLGWGTSSSSKTATYQPGARINNLTSGSSYTLYAVWAQYSVTFYDGSTKLSITPLSGAAGDEVTLPAYNAATKSGYSIAAWTIGQTNHAQNSKYIMTAANVNATAVWASVKLRKRGTGADSSENLDDVGTLIVKSSEDGYDVAIPLTQITETVSGVSRKAWLFAPKPNVTYRVSCELGIGEPDKFWAFSGLTNTSGESVSEISIGATLSNVVENATFTRKVLKQVTTDAQPEVDSIDPEDMVATLAVTTPSVPDVAPNTYITGQQITATAQYPDGMMGWKLVNAVLEIGGASSTPIPNYIDGDNINIPASNFTDDMRIVGVFGRIDCIVSANADGPSATAVSGVGVKKFSAFDDDWVPASKAKYGETVRIYATVDTARGYALDGIYANGVRIATEIPSSGYVEYEVQGETAFVVKAKVRVSLGVGHWNVSGNTWTDGNCFITASVGGVPVDAPQSGFDVVLGQIVNYAVNIRSGWYFDAWFDGTESSKPASFDNPVDMQISDAAFVPTVPLAVIARVTDEILSYDTKVAFVNNDNPSDPVTIEADAENVSSFPESDEIGISEGKVVLTYSSGTKPVTLTFKENIGNLYFEGLQEFVRNEWIAASVEGTVYSMLTSKNRTLRALYTTAGERTVRVVYANVPNVSPGTEARVCGEIGIVESTSSDGKTFVANRGTPFTLRAIPKNGWRFVGWYYEPTHIGVPKYTGQEATANVISSRTLYAYFEPDTHAVYEWEGRNENKMMTWKSKVYVSSRPFNPSAIRVDAEDARGRGTSIARVEVGMMSAPDGAPTASVVLTNMPNYKARRLPHKRPERYIQVEVQNDAEIDRVIIGTSMEGLAV